MIFLRLGCSAASRSGQDFALKGLMHTTALVLRRSYVIHHFLLWARQEPERALKSVLCLQRRSELQRSWELLNIKNVLLLWQPEDTQESNQEHAGCINSITNHTLTNTASADAKAHRSQSEHKSAGETASLQHKASCTNDLSDSLPALQTELPGSLHPAAASVPKPELLCVWRWKPKQIYVFMWAAAFYILYLLWSIQLSILYLYTGFTWNNTQLCLEDKIIFQV